MHFFNPYALAHRLRDNTLSEREKFGYVIASLIMRLVAELPNRFLGSRQPVVTVILGTVLYALVSVVGLRVCFATNTRGDSKHFIERFFCLSMPLLVWLNVLPAYLYFAVYLSGFFSGALFARFNGFIMLGVWMVSGLFLILYFVLLNRLIGIAAGASPSRNKSDFAPIASP